MDDSSFPPQAKMDKLYVDWAKKNVICIALGLNVNVNRCKF